MRSNPTPLPQKCGPYWLSKKKVQNGKDFAAMVKTSCLSCGKLDFDCQLTDLSSRLRGNSVCTGFISRSHGTLKSELTSTKL